jgi:hypothetical protein
MSDDNERSFSSGRDMITYRRTRLLPDIIEACQCLKSWLSPIRARDGEAYDTEKVFDDENELQKDYEQADGDNGEGGGDSEV